MSVDPSGVAAPEDPAAEAVAGTSRPRFKPGAERVDESSVFPPEMGGSESRGRRIRASEPEGSGTPRRRAKLRARKVRRIVRHVEPWSVLKISVLFFISLFLIICVASTVLWNAARSAGAIDDVESFVTSLGFGNCEDVVVQTPVTTPVTSVTTDGTTEPDATSSLPNKDGECADGQQLVGGFKFDDHRIFQAFALGGAVLVLAGAAGSVVMALLFNLISDITGGVRVTVLEEEPVLRARGRTGSPRPRGRG
jgi:hypothetical protein